MSWKKIALVLLLGLLLGPGYEPAAAQAGKLHVAVSIAPQAYFVERIGGERVKITVVMPPYVDHDTFEPTPKQLIELSRADLFVKIGISHFIFEQKQVEPVLRKRGGRVADMSEGIGLLADDPHIWIAPHTVRIAAQNIYRALAALSPSDDPFFKKNLSAFLKEIDEAEAYARRGLAGKEGCCFVIYHPALGYLAHRYSLRQLVIESEGKPPSALHFRNIAEEARKNKLSAILVQKGFDHKSAQAIAREIGARLVEIDPMERNWPKNIQSIVDKLKQVAGR